MHISYISCILFTLYRPDTQRKFVDVGYGFHVEFTLSEALNYIEKGKKR